MAHLLLVGVGTAVACELRRLSTRPPDAKLMDELKGTEARLTKLVAKLEADLAKEQKQRAAADGRASDLVSAAADLKKARAALTAQLAAAEARAAKLTAARDALAAKAAALQLDADAARAQLTAALQTLKDDVGAALAKYARGGYGKKGAADKLFKALAAAGVAVDASAADFAAAAAAPHDAARLELSVDSASFARRLRLVTDDPERIARALAASAAGVSVGADAARLSLPLRTMKTPPKAVLAAAAAAEAAAAKRLTAASAKASAAAARRPASPPRAPSLEADSPPSSPRIKGAADAAAPPASGGRFRLKAIKRDTAPKRPVGAPRLGLDVGVTGGGADGKRVLSLALDDGGGFDDLNAARDLALRG